MRTYIKIIAVAVLITSIFTSESAFAGTPFRKLGRGVCNVALCPLEIAKGISDANIESGYFAAVSWGLLQGVFNTAVRCIVGAYEIVTFPVPLPKDYEPILKNPEFFGEEMAF